MKYALMGSIPEVLFHKVLGGYTGYDKEDIELIIHSILAEGLIPKVATAYNLWLPEAIREFPIVWLARELNFVDYRVLSIETSYLCLDKLYKLSKEDVAWWVYQGLIPPRAIVRTV